MLRSGDSAGAMITALAVGQVTHDRYGDLIVPGGCAFYAAMTFAGLGARTGLATSVGKDFVGDAELSGLEVMRRVGGHSTVFLNTYPADGPRIQWIDAIAPLLDPEVVTETWTRSDAVFLGPVFGELDLTQWSASVKGRVLGLGLQGLLKQAGRPHPDIAGRRAVVARPFSVKGSSLAGVDAVFLSEEDIEVFGSERLVEDLRGAVPLVAVTCGERGSTIYQRDRALRVGVAKADVIDPTGAGDTYAAAFLFCLARGDSVEQAARLAAAAAAIVVEGRGGERLSRIGEAFERVTDVPLDSC